MDEEKEIQDGFNAGYLLKRYKPELTQKINESLTNIQIPFIKGFVAGVKEVELEKEQGKNKLLGRLYKGISRSNKDREKGLDLDK